MELMVFFFVGGENLYKLVNNLFFDFFFVERKTLAIMEIKQRNGNIEKEREKKSRLQRDQSPNIKKIEIFNKINE